VFRDDELLHVLCKNLVQWVNRVTGRPAVFAKEPTESVSFLWVLHLSNLPDQIILKEVKVLRRPKSNVKRRGKRTWENSY